MKPERIRSRLISSIKCGIKPEVKLTQEHKAMIEAIADVWQKDSAIARKLERAFVAICNGEAHD